MSPEDLELSVHEYATSKIEEIDEEIEELEEVRESLWTRFLRSMRSSRRSEAELRDDILDDVVPAIDTDVKDVLKVMHKWLERLPSNDMNQFKRSEDFEQYKTILEKYDLIKK